MFITIEGIEGSGKSTQALLLVEYLQNVGIDCIHTREPGGTVIAEKIRKILLEQNNLENITPQAELLLMFAARSQHLTNVILPALDAGKYVICERFTDASFAYQGGGRGLDFKYIDCLANLVQGNLKPNLVLLFDLETNLALSRVKSRGQLDRIEQERVDFFQKIREVYLQLALKDPKRYYVIDASIDVKDVHRQVIQIIQHKIIHPVIG